MTTVQNRKKLALKFYNYSVLDQLDRPLEYRINEQYKARSAEVLYVSRPEDFELEPMMEGHQRVPHTIMPFPSIIEPAVETLEHDYGFLIRVATPWEEFKAIWEVTKLGDYKGAFFDAVTGGYLQGRIAKHSAARKDAPLKYIAERVQMAWATNLDTLLSKESISFVTHFAPNRRSTEAFEDILRMVPNFEYVTIKMETYPKKKKTRYANAHTFYLAHKSNAKQIYLELEKTYGR